VSIGFSHLAEANELEISVVDTGAGIAEEAIGKIFQPFQQERGGGSASSQVLATALVLAFAARSAFAFAALKLRHGGSGALAEWLADKAAVQSWMEEKREEIVPDLACWRLVRIRDFLPTPVAEEALALAQGLEEWRRTSPVEEDDAIHQFRYRGLNETGGAFAALQEVLGDLLPALQSVPTRAEFRFGRYGHSHG
ncbi:luxQ, partial [Symbiodinium pilosum]